MGTASRVLGIDSSEATAVHQNLAHANSGLAASSIDEVSASEKAATPATTAAATATADATAASTTATTATTDATNATTVVPKPSAATAAVHPLLNSVSSVMSTVASNASNASNAASVVASPKLSQDNSYVLEGESAAHSHASACARTSRRGLLLALPRPALSRLSCPPPFLPPPLPPMLLPFSDRPYLTPHLACPPLVPALHPCLLFPLRSTTPFRIVCVRDATDFSCTIGVASGHAFCGVV
eukprot:829846-Pleurochrysis_carterae.AAC.1